MGIRDLSSPTHTHACTRTHPQSHFYISCDRHLVEDAWASSSTECHSETWTLEAWHLRKQKYKTFSFKYEKISQMRPISVSEQALEGLWRWKCGSYHWGVLSPTRDIGGGKKSQMYICLFSQKFCRILQGFPASGEVHCVEVEQLPHNSCHLGFDFLLRALCCMSSPILSLPTYCLIYPSWPQAPEKPASSCRYS